MKNFPPKLIAMTPSMGSITGAEIAAGLFFTDDIEIN